VPAAPASFLRLSGDATVHGAHLVPENPDLSPSLGGDGTGGSRSFAGGLRVLRLPGGGLRASEDRFPSAPTAYALPPRLGGGFLFAVAPGRGGPDSGLLYRSATWLSEPRPVYSAPRATPIADVLVGLDRVYVRAADGAQAAIDPRSGQLLDAGPWPSGPTVASFRALDGWLAVAIVDLRGAVATFDAGATWKPLRLPDPVHPKSVEVARIDAATGEAWLVPPGASAIGDFLVVKGAEPPRQTEVCYAVRADATISRLSACPGLDPLLDTVATDSAIKPFGGRSLLAAVEDGWPTGDETALVARDGALGSVRLSDGVILRVNADAFPPKPARCHPMPVLVDAEAPVLGFACAEPGETTVLYTYDPGRFVLQKLRSFEPSSRGGRPILSFGNGAIAVEGGCETGGSLQTYCVLSRERGSRSPRWLELSLASGDDRRLLVFDDGRIGILVPPGFPPGGHPPDPQAAVRLKFVGEGDARVVELELPPVEAVVERALREGVWLAGFEERTPGVLSGWVEASGAMLGVEIEESGHVRVGEYIRDAGSPMVSGRYGLGWGMSHRAYETTNGGMTWTPLEVPDALTAPSQRACGPVGCSAVGWLRIGWGKATGGPLKPVEPGRVAWRTIPDLNLDCDPWVPTPSSRPKDDSSFYGAPPPSRHPEDGKLSVDAFAFDPVDRAPRNVPLARIHAWGPRSDDWGRSGRWAVQWLSPYASSRDVRGTASALAPFTSVDSARRALGVMQPGSTWSMAVGEESTFALLVGRRPGPEWTAVTLEADHAPVEIRRSDGEPLAEVTAVTQTGGLWYLATAQAYGEPPATVILRVDGGRAQELARVPRTPLEHPRAGFDARGIASVRLARRTDGRAIGLVVEGPIAPDRAGSLRWVLPIDLETGARGEPELLGVSDLSDRGNLSPCAEGDSGWILDTPWGGKARVNGASQASTGLLTRLYIRLRLSGARACLEQLSGSFEPNLPGVTLGNIAAYATTSSQSVPLVVSALSDGRRSLLRCHSR
jgi:hypothetical protein